MKYNRLLFLNLMCFGFLVSYAQRDKDTIKTEKLIVIKQYSPTLNDAFKVNSKPTVTDSIRKTQKHVEYSIFSVPVASTFTPVKGTASAVKPDSKPYVFQNYARFGAGNFTNILAQLYGSVLLNRDQKIDIDFNHFSSAGGIENVLVDDNFLDTDLILSFQSEERYFVWSAGLDVDYKRYNWYGIDQGNMTNSGLLFGANITDIDPLQTYVGLSAFGQMEFDSDFIKKTAVRFQNFSDDYGSSENQINFDSDFRFYLNNDFIDLNLNLNYLSGSFDQSYNLPDLDIDYGFLTASLEPSYQFDIDNFIFDIGVKASILNNVELKDTEIFIYPKINASYNYNEDVVLYAGVGGDLNQNTYFSIVEQNPFVSPTLLLHPTDNAITGFAGINGKKEEISYNLKVFYKQENNYAFFVENLAVGGFGLFLPQDNFEYSNSFELVYDDLSTLALNAEVNYAGFDNFDVGLSVQYFNYSVDDIPEASYLPDFKVNFNANYQIGEKLNLHSTLFYVGERQSVNYVNLPADGIGFGSVSVDGFVDLNLGANYQLSERLGVFVSGKNLLDDNYEQWRNFDVQGIQVMGGLSYQFDW